ncbi:MAG: alpha/beta hydrolase [Candidatus Hodarchaeota archaeon]
MKQEEGNFQGVKDHELYYQAWLPDGDVKATIQLVHGYAEHSGRYGNVVQKLVPEGYAIFADDLYGHGKSNGKRVYIEKFDDFVEDERIFMELINEKYPDFSGKPRFLLGHSMGSLISFHYRIKYPDHFKGVVLSGIGTKSGGMGDSKLLKGIAKGLGKLTPKLVTSSKFKAEDISRDPEVCKAYVEDPLNTPGKITVRLVSEAFVKAAAGVKELAPSIKPPLLIQYGTADKIQFGREEFDQLFPKENVTIKAYEGLRHEIYNELEEDRKIVLQDLLDWLDSNIS